jgi:hypothetical protein
MTQPLKAVPVSRRWLDLACMVPALLVLIVGLIGFPKGWAKARSVLGSLRSTELNRADREANAGGYYEGLIGVTDGLESGRGDLTWILWGKPNDWIQFHAANLSRHLHGDFLQFELLPNIQKKFFGQPFTTNEHGMRDRPYAIAKGPNVFRIAVIGSSMDMGWGVATDDTYVNRLEDWLNARAKRQGLERRYETLNFAVAAYSPMQRLEACRRKVFAFRPDLLIYSATLLDLRLMEIHICDMLQARTDLHYDFLRKAVADAGLTAEDLRRDAKDKLANKDAIKAKLRPYYWSIYDATLGMLASDCQAARVPLIAIVIPRVGKDDAPASRAESIGRLRTLAAHHAIPLFDLTDTFDNLDPSEIEIAPWDNHPNGRGHEHLFLALSNALVHDPALYSLIFP